MHDKISVSDSVGGAIPSAFYRIINAVGGKQMKKLKASNCDKYIIVDDCDYESVCQYKWRYAKTGNSSSVITSSRKGNKIKHIYIHRFIMNPPTKMVVDHINHNPLDNRRSNLRVCTQSQNIMNARKAKKKRTSKYKGVSLVGGFWTTYVLNRYVGRFNTEVEAAKAYNCVASILFGEFACLNNLRTSNG
jgi:hypothetical protein